MYLRGPHDLFLWSLSSVPSQMRVASSPAYRTDFHDWVTYGSWTSCPSCHSFQFDTDSFKNLVSYSARSRRSESICSLDFWHHQRSHIPAPPTAHSGFEPEAYYVDLADSPALKLTPPLGVSCRWWYHPLLYSPSRLFSFCTVPDGLLAVFVHFAFSLASGIFGLFAAVVFRQCRCAPISDSNSGQELSRKLREKLLQADFTASSSWTKNKVSSLFELYRVPYVREANSWFPVASGLSCDVSLLFPGLPILLALRLW